MLSDSRKYFSLIDIDGKKTSASISEEGIQ